MERSGEDVSAVNRCALVASGGMPGRCISQVCVALMVVPLGMRTVMPLVIGFTFIQGLLMCRKWPVLPVSAIAMVDDGLGWSE